jgi:hypothetical protein
MSRPCRGCGAPLSPDLVAIGARTCGSCAVLLQGIDEPEPPAPAPPPPDAAVLRAQLDESARRREVVWLTGQISLLRRCATFGPEARPQPR